MDEDEPGPGRIAFEFEGRKLQGRVGETIAAALTAAGERELRETKAGQRRGIFCGMGVCQECLVEIDGRPNQRACMTKLCTPVAIRRQPHFAAAIAPSELEPRPRPDASPLAPDVLVVGGGAAGLRAATAAASAGAQVLLVDERPQPGGQFYKQPLGKDAAPVIGDDAQFAGGRKLIAAAEAAGVTFLNRAQVWGAFEPLNIMIFDGSVSRLCQPKRLIVASGAYERGLPFPGWTLPGVMTTGAAQTLLRSYGVLAGQRLLVAGNGPLNLQVALEMARAGAQIVGVVELARRPGVWAASALAKMLTSTPALALRGCGYLAQLKRRGIPLLYNHVISSVVRTDRRLRAHVSRWPAQGAEKTAAFDVDAVCTGYGFMPSNELLRALGCQHTFDPRRGHLTTEQDADGLTSVAHVYAVGDCTGLGGAAAAEADGALAGFAAARSLGLDPPAGRAQIAAKVRAQRDRHRRFQSGLWALFRAPRLLTELADPETIICRCEELARREIEASFGEGSSSAAAVKRLTRVGMGRCQGRYCGPVIAALSASHTGEPVSEAAHWAPRPPVTPIRIADIV